LFLQDPQGVIAWLAYDGLELMVDESIPDLGDGKDRHDGSNKINNKAEQVLGNEIK
jgi:hypothetical protein